MDNVNSIEQLQDVVRGAPFVGVAGAGTKSALSRGANVSLTGLSGILEYEPSEYTFTALAGTPLAEIRRALAEHGQYLPFDPPMVDAGATLGGTIAAGLSGPGRFRYGGVRDFILGVRMITGTGRVVIGGSKVVKNAAGFDIPKLLVGSLGHFGVIAEATFKVFPEPEAYATLLVDMPDCEAATDVMTQLAAGPLQIHCLDLEPPNRLCVRIGGIREALDPRLARMQNSVDGRGQVLRGDEERQYWHDVNHFAWAGTDHAIVKVPILIDQIAAIEKVIAELPSDVPRRYSVGGHVAWLAWPDAIPASALDALLQQLGRPALALTGDWPDPVLGPTNGQEFADPLLSVFDPDRKFQPQRTAAGVNH